MQRTMCKFSYRYHQQNIALVLLSSLRVCLIEWILGRVKKKYERKWEGKLFGGCLVRRGRRKRDVKVRMFLLRSIKKFSSQNGKKTQGREGFYAIRLTKMPVCTCIWVSTMSNSCFFFFFSSNCLFLPIAFFLLLPLAHTQFIC